MRHNFKRKRLRLWVKLTLIVFICLAVFFSLNAYFSPLFAVLAKDKAGNIITQTINSTVCEELQKENLSYNDLVHIERSENNAILSIQTDTVKINNLKSNINLSIQEKMGSNNFSGSIPLGTVSGISFFMGQGPNVDYQAIFLSSVVDDLKSEFTTTGINQTKHTVYLEIKCYLNLMLPDFNEAIEIKTNVTIAETVIVGDVPEIYTNI